jgi:hypothetical protein
MWKALPWKLDLKNQTTFFQAHIKLTGTSLSKFIIKNAVIP